MARRKSLWSVTAAMDEPELAGRAGTTGRSGRAGEPVSRAGTDDWHTSEFPAIRPNVVDTTGTHPTIKDAAPARGAAAVRATRPPNADRGNRENNDGGFWDAGRWKQEDDPAPNRAERRRAEKDSRHAEKKSRRSEPPRHRAVAEPQAVDFVPLDLGPNDLDEEADEDPAARRARRHGRRPMRYSGRRRRFTGAGSLLGGVATLALVLGATSLADAGRNEQANAPIGAQDTAGDSALQTAGPSSSTGTGNRSGNGNSTGRAKAAPTTTPSAAAAATIREVATVVNQQLDLLGCGRVTVDPALVAAARSRVDELIAKEASATDAGDPVGPATRAWASGFSGTQVVESILVGAGSPAQAGQVAFPPPALTVPATPAVTPEANPSAAAVPGGDSAAAGVPGDTTAEVPAAATPDVPAASSAPALAPIIRVVPTAPLRCGWTGVGVEHRTSPRKVTYWAIVLGR